MIFFMNKISLIFFTSSSLFGRDKYYGFAVDWLIELLSIIAGFIGYITVGSFYVGLCLYINGMVTDMKIKMVNKSSSDYLDGTRFWMVNVKEMMFHAEIIGYGSFRWGLVSRSQGERPSRKISSS